MSRRLRLFFRKTIAMVLAIFMSVPTGVFAIESESPAYGEDMSVMGVNPHQDTAKKASRQPNEATYDLGGYSLSLSAVLDDDLTSMTYRLTLRGNSKPESDLSLSLTPDPNSNIRGLSLISTKDSSGEDIEAKTNDPDFRDGLESLIVNTKAHDEITYVFKADIRKAEDKRSYILAIGLRENDEDLGLITNRLKASKDLVTNGESTYEELSLTPFTGENIKGTYKEGGLLSNVFTKTDAILWTDYLANYSRENKDVEYDFDLDPNQKTDSSRISLDYYENSPSGFILKKEFSQEIPFSKHIAFEIPRDMVAKVSLSTQVERNDQVKAYSLNNREIKNPIYKEGFSEESSDEDDPDGESQEAKDSEDLIIAEDSDGNKVQVEIKDSNESETTEEPAHEEPSDKEEENPSEEDKKSDESKENSNEALDLNKTALLRKLEEEGKLDADKKSALDSLAKTLAAYNTGETDWQGFLNSIGFAHETYGISIDETMSYTTSLIAGLNPDSYKVALIDLSLVEAYLRENFEDKEEDPQAEDQPSPEEENENSENLEEKKEDSNKLEIEEESREEENSQEASSEEANEELDPFEGARSASDNKEEAQDAPEDNSLEDTQPSEENPDKEALNIENQEDMGLLSRLGDSIKDTFSADSENFKKANEELKQALKDGKSLEEIQNLLYELGDKYELTREEQEKLMRQNDRAIRDLVAYYKDNNLAPNVLAVKEGLDNKKFTINTRFQTSNAVGPILKGQYFIIHLDKKLKVDNPETLEPIRYKGKVIAKPTYDSDQKTITYKITENINDSIDIPLAIDVDYDPKNIPDGSDDLVIVNKVSGLGVTNPKNLLPVKVDRNGNVKGNLIEPGRTDVTQIVEPGANYRVYMDGKANPIYKDGELDGYNWQITITSDHDLSSDFIGLSTNFTLVDGSGLEKIQDVKLNGQPLDMAKNPIAGSIGINDSKNYKADIPSNTYVYNFYTPLAINKNNNNSKRIQEKYMLDISMLIKGQDKIGAKRFVVDGYDKSHVAEKTPNRVGMNNRTTISGKFNSYGSIEWMVTDAISSGDDANGATTSMPLKDRTLTGPQRKSIVYSAVYKIDKNTGQMVREWKPVDDKIDDIPKKGTRPSENQPVGTIAVYQIISNITDLNDENSDKKYGLSGVEISTTADEPVRQEWELNDKIKTMPAQSLEVVDYDGNNVLTGGENENGKKVFKLPAGNDGETSRSFIIPNVKTWDIDGNGKYERIGHKIAQHFPNDKIVDGVTYEYLENRNFYSWDDERFYLDNAVREKTNEVPVDISIIKKDKDTGKPLKGAVFSLLGAGTGTNLEVSTGNDGRANFSNILPGIYTLVENKAPSGYKLDTNSKQVTVQNNGVVSISGANIKADGGQAKHTVGSDKYPSYMNTLHYAVKIGDTVDLYVMLKPDKNGPNGSTNKDTRLNLDIGGANLTGVEIYDVSNSQREAVRQSMTQLAARNVLPSLSKAGNEGNAHKIEINELSSANPDLYSNKSSGYQIKIPKERFTRDWAFLVKLTGKSDSDSVTPSFEWLTDNNTVNEVKIIQDKINLSTKDKEPKVDVDFINEKFESDPVKVKKVIHDKNIPIKDSQKYLEGAEFTLRDSKGEIQAIKLTDENGDVDFGKLDMGTYTIEETTAPKGYRDPKMIFDVRVDEDGQITYKARGLEGTTPIFGEDYYIEDIEKSQQAKTEVNVEDQYWNLVKPRSPKDNIWYAFIFDSIEYHAVVNLKGVNPGYKLNIQFDPRLDFKRSVYNIPAIKNKNGRVVAEGFVNTDTNLLTYVFNENVGESADVLAKIDINGIRPDIYQIKNSGRYSFDVVIDPSNATGKPDQNPKNRTDQKLSQDKKTLRYWLNINWGDYTSNWTTPKYRHYYKDAFVRDGKSYIVALTYFNPDAEKDRSRKLSFDWVSADGKAVGVNGGPAAGKPAFDLREVRVYQVYPVNGSNRIYMPLSNGVRPENDPQAYRPVFIKTGINNQNFNETRNGINMDFNTKQITTSGGMSPNGPLDIKLPAINNGEGYVIEHVFEITDPEKYYNTWRQFRINLENANEVYSATGSKTIALADQTQIEVPKFYTQRLKVANKPYTPGKFKIKKVDETDKTKPLSGAVFALRDSKGNTIYRTSGQDGYINFEDIRPGLYTLSEISPPKGYLKSDKTWRVRVTNEGYVSIIDSSLGASSDPITGNNTDIAELEVTNRPPGVNFRVYKAGEDGNPLEGAEFALKDKKTNKTIAVGKSDAEGSVVFKDKLTDKDEKKIQEGDYILEETKSPAGYKKLDRKWLVKVTDSAKVYVYLEDDKKSQDYGLLKDANWVDVAKRPVGNWNLYDNRRTGYADGYNRPHKLGARIVGINKNEDGSGYVIQRYVVNPEGNTVGNLELSIHREKPYYNNMDWYSGDEEFKVYKIKNPITNARIEDIRLENLDHEEVTGLKAGRYQTTDGYRMLLNLKDVSSPYVVDIKVPYHSETGGVGTGMDLRGMDNTIYWKSDYYESVSDIPVGSKVNESSQGQGAYIGEGSIDVTNEKIRHDFTIKKVKDGEETTTIQGATFTLKDEEGKEVQTKISDENGLVNFTGILPGKYRLEETSPAPGYEKSNIGWDLIVKKDGKVFIRADRPKGWNKVDLTSSNEARTNKSTNINYVDTAITDVNFETGRYKQVFIVNKELLDSMYYPVLEIHSEPEERDINTQNTSVQIYSVAKGATPTSYRKLSNTNQMSYSKRNKRGVSPTRIEIPFTDENTYAMAVVVETDLPKEGGFGLGMDYYRSSTRANGKWAAESYTNQHGIKLKDTSTANRSMYNSGFYSLGKSDRLNPLDYSHTATRSTNPIRNRSAMLYGGLEFGDDLVTAPVRAGNTDEVIIGNTYTNQVMGKNASTSKIEVTTSVDKLPNDQFKIRVETKLLAGSGFNPYYSLKLNNDFEFVTNSTYSDRIPEKPEPYKGRWHKGYNKSANEIIIESSQPKLQRNQAAIIEFKVRPKNKASLQNDRAYKLIQDIQYRPNVSNTATVVHLIESPTVTYKKTQDEITYEEKTVFIREIPIPSTPIRRENKDMFADEDEKQVFAGAPGKVEEVRRYKYVNGVKTNEFTVVDTIETPAKAPIIEYGSKERPSPEPDPQPDPEPGPGTEEPGTGGEDPGTGEDPGSGEDPGTEEPGREDPGTGETPQPEAPEISDDDLANLGFVEMQKSTSTGKPEEIITNKQEGISLSLNKVASLGTKIQGAEFKLEKYQNAEDGSLLPGDKRTDEKIDSNFTALTGITDENGKLNFKGKLKPGAYRLTETVTPDPYKEPASHWDILIREENGQLVARLIGPEETASSFPQSDYAYAGSSKDGITGSGIKYKSKIISIDPVTETFVQRIYVDLSGYRGDGPVNVDIVPKHKREEIDYVGKVPKTIKKGVKTAYRTTYEVKDPIEDVDKMLDSYNLYEDTVSMLNTARWRPFDWGFDEDQLNLPKKENTGYIIEVEGYFDSDYITGEATARPDDVNDKEWSYANSKDTKIPEEDRYKIDLNVYFDKEKRFQQARGQGKYTDGGSYQKGNEALGLTGNSEAGKAQPDGQKYPNWLSKAGGRMVYKNKVFNPGNDSTRDNITKAELSTNVKPLYTSADQGKAYPNGDITIINDEKTYNITFTKLARDRDDQSGQELVDNRLEGAVFKLQQEFAGSWTNVRGSYVASAFNGYFGFRNLKPGRYRLIEVQAPRGYRKVDGPILEFTVTHYESGQTTPNNEKVTESGGWISIEHNEGNSIVKYEPKNGQLYDFVTGATAKQMGNIINEKPGKGKVTIKKTDDEGNLLNGAEFKLTRLGADNPNKDFTYTGTSGMPVVDKDTDKTTYTKDGVLVFDKLPMGNYRLEETKAAPGHKISGGVWNFTVGGAKLDPYTEPISPTGKDLSSDINLKRSTLEVIKPGPNVGAGEKYTIRPNSSESLGFENVFTVPANVTVNPGDYIKVKLTDNINLKGINPNPPEGLDIFADGVGTIAKATYDEEKKVITYTFTDFAKTYSLQNFKAYISAFIDPFKIKVPTNTQVGLSLGDNSQNHDIAVKFDEPIATSSDGRNYMNMDSKIIVFNPKTGYFEQLFYINKEGGYIDRPQFVYIPQKDISGVSLKVFKRNGYWNLNDAMPASFGIVPEWNRNLNQIYSDYYSSVNNYIWYNFDNNIGQNDQYVIKITGTVAGKDKMSFNPRGRLNLYWSNGNTYMYAERNNTVRMDQNYNVAQVDLSIDAVNPKNKIKFVKTDGAGKSLEGAVFRLERKNGESWSPIDKDDYSKLTKDENKVLKKTSDKDGRFGFEKLPEGDYRLIEEKAPDGFEKPKDPVFSFQVNDKGSIFRTYKNEDKKEITEDLEQKLNPIENHRPVKFIKIDGDKKTGLAGAVFEVYKKDDSNKYQPIKDVKDKEKNLTVTSGKDGSFSLNLTEDGYYALKETKAPEGYTKSQGYIREFRIKYGKVESLEKDITKSYAISEKTKIISKFEGKHKDDTNIFKTRIYIRPSDADKLELTSMGWSVPNQDGAIRLAKLGKDKSLADLKKEDFKDVSGYTTYQGENYYTYTINLPQDVTSDDLLMYEFVGTRSNNDLEKLDLKARLVDSTNEDTEVDSLVDTIYPDKTGQIYKEKDPSTPIEVENSKAEYPFTGGPGVWSGFTVLGLLVMIAGAYVYHRRRLKLG